jgi:hypothetical protein
MGKYLSSRSWGIHSYRPHLGLPLTREHRRQRLDWCRERIKWDAERHVARTVGVGNSQPQYVRPSN